MILQRGVTVKFSATPRQLSAKWHLTFLFLFFLIVLNFLHKPH